jgi:hypothetical protein
LIKAWFPYAALAALIATGCGTAASDIGRGTDGGGDATGGSDVASGADGAPVDAAGGKDAALADIMPIDAAGLQDATGHGDATADSATDSPLVDVSDSGPSDGGSMESGLFDDGSVEGGAVDGGVADGAIDAGIADSRAVDSAVDGGVGDAGQHDASTMCGSTTCYVGQSCVSNQCLFEGCIGTNANDYPRLQDAIAAAPMNGTVCIGARTFNESVGGGNLQKNLLLQGVSPDLSIVESIAADEIGHYTLQGLTVHQISAPLGGTITVLQSAVDSVSFDSNATRITAVFDGDDIGSINVMASASTATFPATVNLFVRNCYVHGGGITFSNYIPPGPQFPESMNATLLNNTIVGSVDGISFAPPLGGSISYFNNLIDGNTTGVSISMGTSLQITQGNNAYFSNGTNFGGIATAGPGDVQSDPLLDTSTTPPGLLPGSPARGAGDPSQAPTTDFWGKPRGAHPDIGAAQSSR